MHNMEYADILEDASKVMGKDERLTLATTLDEKRETWLEKIKEDLMEKIRKRISLESAQYQEDQKNQEGSRPVSMQQGRDCTPVSSPYAVTM